MPRLLLLFALAVGCGDDATVAAGDGGSSFDGRARDDAAADSGSDEDAAAPIDAGWDAGPPPRMPPYDFLSETGLYADIVAKRPSDDALAFAPGFVLWSDGADKQRWIFLPAGERIDTSDPDHWEMPVGTRLFKEFSRDGVRLETRLIERVDDTGSPLVDWWMGAFVWSDDEADAAFAEEGAEDVRGTTHDVPSAMRCFTCHNGEPGKVLGLSAVQMSASAAIPGLDGLSALGLLTDAPPSYAVPGDATVAAALGYLHANCGHCHNEHGTARPDTAMMLRLSVAELALEETAIYTTTVGIALDRFRDPSFTHRVVPGDPAASALLFRMEQRGDRAQMPPIATEAVDPVGVAAVSAFIAGLM